MQYSESATENQPNQGRLAWSTRAEALAEWAMATMVARTDTFGTYLQDGTPTRAKSYGVPTPLTTHALIEHFRGKQCVGLYSCDPTDMVKVVAVDIDNHKDDEPTRSANHRRLQAVLARLKALGMRFLAYTSGKPGGYHVQVPFTEKLPYPLARAFGTWLADLKGEDFEPEVFPKRAVAHTAQKCGNYIRLLMPKPNRPIWPKVITGAEVLEGEEAVAHVLGVTGNDPALIPTEARAFAVPLPRAVRERMDAPAGPRPDWASVATRYKGDLRTLDIVALADEAGWAPTDQGGGWFKVLCPWWADHTSRNTDAYVIENEGRYPGFFCHHAHCEGRTVLDVLATFPPDKVDAHCGRAWDESRAEKERAKAKLDDLFKNRIDIDELPVVADDLGDGNKTTPPPPPPKENDPFTLYSLSDLKAMKKPRWLVRNHFHERSLVQVFGDTGSCKSFYLLEMGLSVASGVPALGLYPVKQGPVVYLSAEGAPSLQYRIEAWMRHRGLPFPEGRFFVLPLGFDLGKSLDGLRRAVDKAKICPSLTMVDTVARYYGPGDENNTQDMNAFVESLDKVKRMFDGTAMVAHHTGWDNADRERGAKSLRNACDTIVRLEKGANVRVSCEKQKDGGDPFDLYLLRREKYTLDDVDDDGLPITSLALQPHDPVSQEFILLPPAKKEALVALWRHYNQAPFTFNEAQAVIRKPDGSPKDKGTVSKDLHALSAQLDCDESNLLHKTWSIRQQYYTTLAYQAARRPAYATSA